MVSYGKRLLLNPSTTMWFLSLSQMWTHYKIGKLNMWTLFCNICIAFLNNPIWKEIMLKLNGKPSSLTMFSTNFSFQNLVFWNLFGFQWQKSLNTQYLLHPKSKSYQINSIKSSSSRFFQQYQRHLLILLKFLAMI